MKISYTWLKEMVATDADPKTIADRLTLAGLAVETIEPHGDDVIFDLDLTSNRPDALSHLGVAREVAALFAAPLTPPVANLEETGPPASELASVEIRDPDLCPRYSARVVQGVTIGPSPDWLVARLEALGQRSINNVADVTNYVLLELGHPLHAFDLDALAERRIVVRRAAEGETLVTLEKVVGGEDEYRERTLSPEMLVIADAEVPVAIGGIKGGKGTGIGPTTANVLLEAAYFKPTSVRKTARALKLDTDASHRFERGADVEMTVRALDRAAALVVEVAGGVVCEGVVDVYPQPVVRTPIPLRRARVESLVGTTVAFDAVVDALHRLAFRVEPLADAEELLAVAPSYRVDIAIEEDLVEEVARIVGYETIPATLPGWGGSGSFLHGEERRRAMRSALVDIGFDEAVSFSFVERDADERLTSEQLGGRGRGVDVTNPILEHKPRMRTSLVTGLVEAFETNAKFGTRSVRLFEIGKRFLSGDGDARPEERETLSLLIAGTVDDHDYRARREADFYDMKGAVEVVMERLGVVGFTFDRARVEYLHRGQSSAITLEGEIVGVFGRLSPEFAAERKFRQPVFVAEIALDSLLAREPRAASYRKLARYPSVVRDVSVVVPRSVDYAAVEAAVRDLGVANLVDVALYDVFAGGQIPEDKHSVTVRVTYRSDERTLTDDEVAASHARVVDELTARFGAALRA